MEEFTFTPEQNQIRAIIQKHKDISVDKKYHISDMCYIDAMEEWGNICKGIASPPVVAPAPIPIDKKSEYYKKCVYCGNRFMANDFRRRFCCKDHKDKYHNRKKRKSRLWNWFNDLF